MREREQERQRERESKFQPQCNDMVAWHGGGGLQSVGGVWQLSICTHRHSQRVRCVHAHTHTSTEQKKEHRAKHFQVG